MIQLRFETAVAFVMIGALGWLLAQWGQEGRRRPPKPLPFDKTWIWQCTICMFTFVERRPVRLSRCPRCQSLVEKRAPIEETVENEASS